MNRAMISARRNTQKHDYEELKDFGNEAIARHDELHLVDRDKPDR